jgi:hypothetical protein
MLHKDVLHLSMHLGKIQVRPGERADLAPVSNNQMPYSPSPDCLKDKEGDDWHLLSLPRKRESR